MTQTIGPSPAPRRPPPQKKHHVCVCVCACVAVCVCVCGWGGMEISSIHIYFQNKLDFVIPHPNRLVVQRCLIDCCLLSCRNTLWYGLVLIPCLITVS